MDVKLFLTVFVSVLIAELGDKTQLATMLFATDKRADSLTVFVGASLALTLASAVGVLAGDAVSQYVSEKPLRLMAATGFIAIGAWMLFRTA
ncbi:MAG: TMEM165/GDT1 family protein [Dissulfurimicrobium sp.]|uniref:TMEM165/GDT1 family protein n=1 Tax=Dissulfurimicrobium TaxID=1769732 RepID=UPI001EDC26DE|nr:TMEM165/GDT1 family protein [Dissulfurimicrobium hydrothermale]UKL12966.1 TMEM165/GDT1 family protein [Dissulfurimicrobium hydrothermale]